MLSPSDTAIVFVLALLLFGPDQLPKLARQLGEAMRHIQSTTHTFMQEMERAAEPGDMMRSTDHADIGEPILPPEPEPNTGASEAAIDPAENKGETAGGLETKN